MKVARFETEGRTTALHKQARLNLLVPSYHESQGTRVLRLDPNFKIHVVNA
jgi:hypothetical protein